MRFVLRMARRELRASWRRLLFFFLCVGFGVGAVVALRTVIRNVREAMTGEARQMLTADVSAETTRPWSPEVLGKIERAARAPLVLDRTETVEASTMARPADPSVEAAQMVELKGVEPQFPLYGEFRLQGGRAFDYALLEGRGAVVAPLLLERLRLKVGDLFKIGEATFEVRGVIEREPGPGSGFRLGPRVFVERKAIEEAGLTGFGSRARRRLLFKTAEGGVEELAARLRAELGRNVVTVRSYRESQENLGEEFERGENFLALAGLVVLVLGGVGVSGVTRVFIEQKERSVAILKCVGATGRRVTAAYHAQTIALGLAGSLLGVALAKAALLFVSYRFAASLPPNMSYALSPGAVAQGLGLGLLISTLFSALPLLRVRRIKPDILLRERDEDAPRRLWRDPLRLAAGALLTLALFALASWQAGSPRVGFYFLAGLASASALLYAAAWLLVFALKRARRAGTFAVRQAIGGLHRPGNQTRVVVLAVGLGAFLVLTVQSIKSSLLDEMDFTRRAGLANMYLIDIQKDQAGGGAEMVEAQTGEPAALIPTVRARIYAIDGEPLDLEREDLRRDRGLLGREYVTTYRPRLEANETLVAGRFWDETPSAEPEVSIEEGMRGVAGLDVGSTITFDILGSKVTARVTSVRKVDWRNSRTGFLVLFRPGVLEAAPQTFVGAVNGPADPQARARFQRAVLDRYPNVSVIDVFDIVASLRNILGNIALAVTFIGGFVLLSGVLILIGSIAMTKYQRVYESAVLKTLGARRSTLAAILLTEYGLLGLVAGVVGAAAAAALSYAVTTYLFKIPWGFSAPTYLLGVLATVLLVTAVGALASFDVLTRKPLAILRGQ